jgi:hypothetical protein
MINRNWNCDRGNVILKKIIKYIINPYCYGTYYNNINNPPRLKFTIRKDNFILGEITFDGDIIVFDLKIEKKLFNLADPTVDIEQIRIWFQEEIHEVYAAERSMLTVRLNKGDYTPD